MSRRLMLEACVYGLVQMGLMRAMAPGEEVPVRKPEPPKPEPIDRPVPQTRQARRAAARAAAKLNRKRS